MVLENFIALLMKQLARSKRKEKENIFGWTAFHLVKQSLAMGYSGQFNLVKDDLNRDNVMELGQK